VEFLTAIDTWPDESGQRADAGDIPDDELFDRIRRP